MKTNAENQLSAAADIVAGVAPLPRVVADGAALREMLWSLQQAGQTVGLVPTMGALHEGHLSLVDAARAECDVAVVTIFVNPTQFAPNEDFKRYPRDLDKDLKLFAGRGCDIVFAPTTEAMYPPDHATFVDVGPIAHTLEGEIRPTHFRGVATIVLKLFELAPADRAYFGRKDYQQTLVIQRMVTDLNVPMTIRVCPTMREPDGLAMSSRNAYLSADERRRALSLSQSLRLAEKLASQGEQNVATIRAQMEDLIGRAGGVEIQYIAFVADGTVTPITKLDAPATIAIAVKVGKTRLIDNIRIG